MNESTNTPNERPYQRCYALWVHEHVPSLTVQPNERMAQRMSPMSENTPNERTYQRSIFKNDIALSLVMFTWIYWLCEIRWFRKAIGGRWYQSSHGNVRFWTKDVPKDEIATEDWLQTPIAMANDTSMGVLVRLVAVLGVISTLGRAGSFTVTAPLVGVVTACVWWLLVVVYVRRQQQRLV